jgi:hypothetical protein
MAWARAPHRAPYTLYSSTTTVVRNCDDCLLPAARLVLNCATSKTKVIVIALPLKHPHHDARLHPLVIQTRRAGYLDAMKRKKHVPLPGATTKATGTGVALVV